MNKYIAFLFYCKYLLMGILLNFLLMKCGSEVLK